MTKKQSFFHLWLIIACLWLAGCGDGGTVTPPAEETNLSWAVYWYLCGSDLESWYGCAHADLEEMLAVNLPEDVKVIIQTGGATHWEREDMHPDRIGRYVYDDAGLRLLEQQPQANMAETETLSDFLRFCTENYPADRTMMLFWNHGGGSVTGAEFDANYAFDSLTLDEFRSAFEQVFTLDANTPPFEVVGFDACLMATIDVADVFSDVGKYLVASEELEPGNGWYYTDWLRVLAENTKLDGAQLGAAICDAYMRDCELAGTQEDVTLSVIDLSKVGALLTAYNDLGIQALVETIGDPSFYTSFSRGAVNSESYGGNTQEQGYANMVDLGHLARNSESLLPEGAQEVQNALEECVLYRVNGPYRSESTGLSCYHSYNGDLENFVDYTGVGCSEAFKYLYGYGLSGAISEAGMEYVRAMSAANVQMPAEPERFDISVLENAEICVDDYGLAELYVGSRAADALVSVQFILASFDEDKMVNLGWSDTAASDFDEGLFTDLVDGYWPSIDGCPVHTEVVYQGDDYTIYSVPVLLNGEQCNLRVVYDEEKEEYTVLGARKGLADNGMADKNLIKLKAGDALVLLYQERALLAGGDFVYKLGETICVTEETMFYEAPLPPGEYGMMFKMFDACGNSALSEVLNFSMDEEYIYFY